MNKLSCYIVSYDIRDQKRLCRVHRAMKSFGDPVHYSVFRCDLTAKGRAELMTTLIDLIDPEEDRVMIIDLGPVAGKCLERIEFLGANPKQIERKFIIV